jgi:hypothetical protein
MKTREEIVPRVANVGTLKNNAQRQRFAQKRVQILHA